MELSICINFWNKITKHQGYCTKKIDMTHLVKITIGLRYQRGPIYSQYHIRCDFVNVKVTTHNLDHTYIEIKPVRHLPYRIDYFTILEVKTKNVNKPYSFG